MASFSFALNPSISGQRFCSVVKDFQVDGDLTIKPSNNLALNDIEIFRTGSDPNGAYDSSPNALYWIAPSNGNDGIFSFQTVNGLRQPIRASYVSAWSYYGNWSGDNLNLNQIDLRQSRIPFGNTNTTMTSSNDFKYFDETKTLKVENIELSRIDFSNSTVMDYDPLIFTPTKMIKVNVNGTEYWITAYTTK